MSDSPAPSLPLVSSNSTSNPLWFVIGLPLGAIAVVAFLVLWLVGLHVLLAALLGLLLAGAIGALLFFRADTAVSRFVKARPAKPGEQARVANLIDELCVKSGLAVPELWVIDVEEPGALSFGRAAPGSIAVTKGLVNRLGVIEIEGILARELLRIKDGGTRLDTLSVVFLRAPLAPFGDLGRRLVEGVRGADRDVRADLAGVGLTRYPPGLRKGLEELSARPGGVPSGPQFTEQLWTTGPRRGKPEPGVFTLDDRIAVLREL